MTSLLISHNNTISWLYLPNGHFRIIFLLRDSASQHFNESGFHCKRNRLEGKLKNSLKMFDETVNTKHWKFQALMYLTCLTKTQPVI